MVESGIFVLGLAMGGPSLLIIHGGLRGKAQTRFSQQNQMKKSVLITQIKAYD
jgi:hypothetical protein